MFRTEVNLGVKARDSAPIRVSVRTIVKYRMRKRILVKLQYYCKVGFNLVFRFLLELLSMLLY